MNVDFRTEYPHPQFFRKGWICLNGVWDFTIDWARSGENRKFQKRNGQASRRPENEEGNPYLT